MPICFPLNHGKISINIAIPPPLIDITKKKGNIKSEGNESVSAKQNLASPAPHTLNKNKKKPTVKTIKGIKNEN
jgi:hypothetical protein